MTQTENSKKTTCDLLQVRARLIARLEEHKAQRDLKRESLEERMRSIDCCVSNLVCDLSALEGLPVHGGRLLVLSSCGFDENLNVPIAQVILSSRDVADATTWQSVVSLLWTPSGVQYTQGDTEFGYNGVLLQFAREVEANLDLDQDPPPEVPF